MAVACCDRDRVGAVIHDGAVPRLAALSRPVDDGVLDRRDAGDPGRADGPPEPVLRCRHALLRIRLGHFLTLYAPAARRAPRDSPPPSRGGGRTTARTAAGHAGRGPEAPQGDRQVVLRGVAGILRLGMSVVADGRGSKTVERNRWSLDQAAVRGCRVERHNLGLAPLEGACSVVSGLHRRQVGWACRWVVLVCALATDRG